VRARGFNTNYRLDTRNHPRFPKRVEKGLRKVEATPEMTLELVLLKSECAVFMNGQAVGHWKIPPSKDPIKLSYFLSGVICEIKEVEIWELNSAVE